MGRSLQRKNVRLVQFEAMVVFRFASELGLIGQVCTRTGRSNPKLQYFLEVCGRHIFESLSVPVIFGPLEVGSAGCHVGTRTGID